MNHSLVNWPKVTKIVSSKREVSFIRSLVHTDFGVGPSHLFVKREFCFYDASLIFVFEVF